MDVSTTVKRTRTEQCQRNAKTKSEQKRRAAFEALSLIRQEGCSVTKAAVAKRAGVSVVFLRAHPDLVQAIEEAEQRRLHTPTTPSPDRTKDQVIAALRRRLDEMKHTLEKKDVEMRQKQREIDQLYGKLAAASPLTDLELRHALTEAHARLKHAEELDAKNMRKNLTPTESPERSRGCIWTVCLDKQEASTMIESEYVTIQEAARRCGVSDKTIQRAIRRGTLPAQYPQPNRCEILVSDLERFRQGSGPMSGHATGSLESRVAALEQRVKDLENLVQCLQMRQEPLKPYRASQAREQVTGPLPKSFISLLVFARLHNVTEAKALTAIEIHYVPVKKGAWTAPDGTAVTLALDAKGKAAFYQLYQDLPFFLPCKQCPH